MQLPSLHDERYKQTKVDRFWPRVAVGGPDECWPWLGGMDRRKGYGLITRGGKLMTAHRMAYTLVAGEPPAGTQIHHLCWNRLCCNPAHMEAMTVAAHMRIHNPGELDCRQCGGEKGAVLYRGKMRYVCHPCEAERKRKERMS